jgi:hypothetical protein
VERKVVHSSGDEQILDGPQVILDRGLRESIEAQLGYEPQDGVLVRGYGLQPMFFAKVQKAFLA